MLLALGVKALPPAQRLRGWYLWLVVAVATLAAVSGLIGGLSGIGMAWR